MSRAKRQNMILELITSKDIETQEELVEELKKAGYDVTQATISRDIKDLGIVKVSVDGKRQKYDKEHTGVNVTQKFADMYRHSVIAIDCAMNMIVVKTLSGSANVVAVMIDRLNNKDILGCVAGDDTVFAVLRDENAAKEMAEALRRIAFN